MYTHTHIQTGEHAPAQIGWLYAFVAAPVGCVLNFTIGYMAPLLGKPVVREHPFKNRAMLLVYDFAYPSLAPAA